jgi:photosystem II stability/assembly factor-like uncharacterized protein
MTICRHPQALLLTAILLLSLSWMGCQSSTDSPDTEWTLENPSWMVQYEDSTTNFIGLFAVNSSTVWASGSGGKYVRTENGGESWISGTVPGADSIAFRDVHAFDNNTAYVLSIGNGTDSRIYRTDDGGTNWFLSFQNNDPNSFFDCFSFWDADRGIAISDSFEGTFRIIRTLDGGMTWDDIPPDVLPEARAGEGAFASSGTCVVTRPGGLGWFSTGASGVDTRVIRTTDYGDSWMEAPTPIESGTSTAGIFTLTFLDDLHGMAMGGDFSARDSTLLNAAVSSDGGVTWNATGMSNIKGSIYGASYVPGAPSPTILAVAPTGSDYTTDNGQSWTLFSEEDFWAVHAVDQRSAWAAGPRHIARLQYAGMR